MGDHEWLTLAKALERILEKMPLDVDLFFDEVWPVFMRTAHLPARESYAHTSSTVVDDFIRLCAKQGYRCTLDQIRRKWADDDYQSDGPTD